MSRLEPGTNGGRAVFDPRRLSTPPSGIHARTGRSGSAAGLAGIMAATFRTLSRLRGQRIFHPHGVGFEATLTPLGTEVGVELFDADATRSALVRLSRSVGLPEALPDPCGLGIRVPDLYGPGSHQDLLLVSSGRAVGGRHLVLPSAGFASRMCSSLLPYRARGELIVIGAAPTAPQPGPKLEDLRARLTANLSFRIAIGSITGGWTPVATLELGERLGDERVESLRFDPANTGGGLELAGYLNRLRRPVYGASQDGRGAPESVPLSAPAMHA